MARLLRVMMSRGAMQKRKQQAGQAAAVAQLLSAQRYDARKLMSALVRMHNWTGR